MGLIYLYRITKLLSLLSEVLFRVSLRSMGKGVFCVQLLPGDLDNRVVMYMFR